MSSVETPRAIRTVLGTTMPEDVNVADAHCHLWVKPNQPGTPSLMDEDAALRELLDFRAAGGTLVVDCQPGGAGRDGAVLVRLARESGVSVVASTGFHLSRYYSTESNFWQMDEKQVLELFLRELNESLDEEPLASAGVVKTAWVGKDGPERNVMETALEAAKRTGAAVIVHTEAGNGIDELVKLVESCGLSPQRVQLSHIDKYPDFGLHRELARSGYVLGYDTFLRPKYHPGQVVWPLLLQIVEADVWPQVTIGLDLVSTALWHVGGGQGLRVLATMIATRLRHAGVPPEAVRALCGGNAARLLAIASAVHSCNGQPNGIRRT